MSSCASILTPTHPAEPFVIMFIPVVAVTDTDSPEVVMLLGINCAPTEVAVSPKCMFNLGATALGNVFGEAVIETVSDVAAVARYLTVIEPAVVESDLAFVAVPATTVIVGAEFITAFDGTELRTPIPNAATATSAMRLKFVFVDICFLSLVVTRNFLVAASR